jgi:hypothetical protein
MELAVEAGLVKKPLMQDLMAEGKKIGSSSLSLVN